MWVYLWDTTLVNGGWGWGWWWEMCYCNSAPNPTYIFFTATWNTSNDCYICCCFTATANWFVTVGARWSHINGNWWGGWILDKASNLVLFCNYCSNCCASDVLATIPVICWHTYVAVAKWCKRWSWTVRVDNRWYVFV